MFEEVKVLTHSSIKISGTKTVYFDPHEVQVHSARRNAGIKGANGQSDTCL